MDEDRYMYALRMLRCATCGSELGVNRTMASTVAACDACKWSVHSDLPSSTLAYVIRKGRAAAIRARGEKHGTGEGGGGRG